MNTLVEKRLRYIERQRALRAGFTDDELDGGWRPFRAVGCSACNNGYKGRVGIYQVMPISEEVQRIILASGSALDLAKQAGITWPLPSRKASGARPAEESKTLPS